MSDVVIVGGACMGSSLAYHLKALDASIEVTVVERDQSLARSSTLLSDGNVRVQFNLDENILMSRYAMEVLERFGDTMEVGGVRPEVSMRRQGNLFLVDPDGAAAARAGLHRQQALGCRTKWLDASEIESAFPPLASDRFLGGTFGPDDGSVDPSGVTLGYRRAAARNGAGYLEADVTAISTISDRATGVRLGDGTEIAAPVVVVCAGAWSAGLLATVGVDIPVVPIMRTVYVVATDVGRGIELPSAFLPSGVYLIPESEGTFLMAWSRSEDPGGFDFTPADRSRFYDVIWPELVGCLPAFDHLEVVRSWAGLYAQNTLDANGIIGEWPGVAGLYMATGFSGHGFQQCHAAGRYLSELITGNEPFMDLTRLGPDRITEAAPLLEHAGRII